VPGWESGWLGWPELRATHLVPLSGRFAKVPSLGNAKFHTEELDSDQLCVREGQLIGRGATMVQLVLMQVCQSQVEGGGVRGSRPVVCRQFHEC
jgi:hypothetical protein